MQNTEGMIYLIACALHGAEPDPALIAEMDHEGVFQTAKRHSLLTLCWYGFGKHTEMIQPEKLRKTWGHVPYAAVRNNMLLNMERDKFFAFCEREGIRYMPLKGTVMQYLYPTPETREMGDNDLLFDEKFDVQVRDYFIANGWNVLAFRLGNHDTYAKPPFYRFDLHRGLVGKIEGRTWDSYYKNPFKNTISDGKSKYGRVMHEEDFYAHIMMHACKHYSKRGTGIRNLVDCYVCRHKLTLERQYLDGELKKLGIVDFEREAATLSEKLFGDPAKTLEELRGMEAGLRKALEYYLGSGTYGTEENWIQNEMRQIAPDEETFTTATRIKYMWKSVFPGKEHMRDWCKAASPFFIRHEWLLWAAPFYRLGYKSLTASKMLRQRMKIIWKQR